MDKTGYKVRQDFLPLRENLRELPEERRRQVEEASGSWRRTRGPKAWSARGPREVLREPSERTQPHFSCHVSRRHFVPFAVRTRERVDRTSVP